MRPMLATAHYATRKGLNRPFARVTARDRRMGQKLSMGLTPKQVARLEGMVPADVETLVAEPEFKALIDGYNTLHAMPEDEQRRILTQLARHLLMEATALGDVRVAMFILLQERMGKDPARTLADGVIAANKRAAAPAPAPRSPSPSPRAHRPSDDSRAAHDAAGGEPPARRAAAGTCGGPRRCGGGRSSSRRRGSWRLSRSCRSGSAARRGLPRPRSSATTRAAPSRPCSC